MGLLRREGTELGTFLSEWLRRLPLLPPEQQGTEKSHHFFGLVAALHVGREEGEQGQEALSREPHLSKSRPGWELAERSQ